MAGGIQIDFGAFAGAHGSLEGARGSLCGVQLTETEGESASIAMDEFRNRLSDLRSIVSQYQGLLQADSQKLYNAGVTFAEKDSEIARSYESSVGGSLG